MVDETVALYCEWCVEDRGQTKPGVVPLGRWAVVFRDCPGCLARDAAQGSDTDPANEALVPNILCTKHLSGLIAQNLPDSCRECGYVRANFTEIIEQVIPLDPFAMALPSERHDDAESQQQPPRRLRVVEGLDEPSTDRTW